MGGGGFEPPKQFAADLQSVPFGHSGIHPYVSEKLLTRLEYSIIPSFTQVNFQFSSHFFSLKDPLCQNCIQFSYVKGRK